MQRAKSPKLFWRLAFIHLYYCGQGHTAANTYAWCYCSMSSEKVYSGDIVSPESKSTIRPAGSRGCEPAPGIFTLILFITQLVKACSSCQKGLGAMSKRRGQARQAIGESTRFPHFLWFKNVLPNSTDRSEFVCVSSLTFHGLVASSSAADLALYCKRLCCFLRLFFRCLCFAAEVGSLPCFIISLLFFSCISHITVCHSSRYLSCLFWATVKLGVVCGRWRSIKLVQMWPCNFN